MLGAAAVGPFERESAVKFLFNFKPKFVAAIESGKKRQTVRATRKDGRVPNVDDIACLYTGLRTRHARLLRESEIIEVLRVRIQHNDPAAPLVIDGWKIDLFRRIQFAQDDGFSCWEEMARFFRDNHPGDTFEGFCVRWKA